MFHGVLKKIDKKQGDHNDPLGIWKFLILLHSSAVSIGSSVRLSSGFGLVSALCEGSGEAGKSAAQIYSNGAGVEGLEYGGRLERLKLMTLEERRNRSDLVELFKMSKDCLPSMGTHSSVQAVLTEQEDIRRSWQRKDSSWISESTSFLKEWWIDGMAWARKWYRRVRWIRFKKDWKRWGSGRRISLWTSVRWS